MKTARSGSSSGSSSNGGPVALEGGMADRARHSAQPLAAELTRIPGAYEPHGGRGGRDDDVSSQGARPALDHDSQGRERGGGLGGGEGMGVATGARAAASAERHRGSSNSATGAGVGASTGGGSSGTSTKASKGRRSKAEIAAIVANAMPAEAVQRAWQPQQQEPQQQWQPQQQQQRQQQQQQQQQQGQLQLQISPTLASQMAPVRPTLSPPPSSSPATSAAAHAPNHAHAVLWQPHLAPTAALVAAVSSPVRSLTPPAEPVLPEVMALEVPPQPSLSVLTVVTPATTAPAITTTTTTTTTTDPSPATPPSVGRKASHLLLSASPLHAAALAPGAALRLDTSTVAAADLASASALPPSLLAATPALAPASDGIAPYVSSSGPSSMAGLDLEASDIREEREQQRRRLHHQLRPAWPPDRGWRWRRPHDVIWAVLFLSLLGFMGYLSVRLGLERWDGEGADATIHYWPMYLTGIAVGAALSVLVLWLLCAYTNSMMKIFVHALTTYLAVVAVFCFWVQEFFWGLFFALGAVLQFAYAIAVVDRLAYTMLVVRRALGFVQNLPTVFVFACAAGLALGTWLSLWSFGLSGVVARQQAELERWWIILLLACSLFWTGVVVCNVVHVVTADVLITWLVATSASATSASLASTSAATVAAAPMAAQPISDTEGSSGSHEQNHEQQQQQQQQQLGLEALPPTLIVMAMGRAALALGSICYGSLFTALVGTLRWMVRGLRGWCGRNECLFCCCDLLFNVVETLTRFLNRFGYVTLAMRGKGFNASSVDAWELFQSTGVDALVAYDLSGAVVAMAITLGALLTGTAVGVWAWFAQQDSVVMIGATCMLIGAFMVAVTLTMVDGAVAAVYVCYAEDPTLLGAVDAQFAAQLTEALHVRLQQRSGKHVPTSLASAGLPSGVPSD